MDFLNQLDNNTLLIVNNNIKEKILLKINNIDKLINVKIMSLNDFYRHYFFSYDVKTIYYVKKKYNITREIVCNYLDNLKYIIDSNIDNLKINFLKDLYIDLIDNNLLYFDNLFKDYLKNKKIIILNCLLDKFTLNILNKYNYQIIDYYDFKNDIKNIYHFDTIEDEVEYTFNKISSLIKDNINPSNIKLILLGNEYNNIIKRFSYFYNININNIDKNSIYATIETKKILNLIKENKSKEDIFNYLKDNYDNYIVNCFINIINKYYFIDNLNDVIDFIEYDLKNTYFKEIKNVNGIDIINLDKCIFNDDSYIFILGFNLENIPKIYKDIDYFSDSLKEDLGLSTSIIKNIYERNKVINIIKSINNLSISYKDNTPYNSYYKSNLIDELNLIENNIYIENNTSNLYNKIKLGDKLDSMIKYNIKDNNLDKLYNTYNDIDYMKYDNKFKDIVDFKLDKVYLSYSSINTYYYCSFRYYIENILNLNIYEETFKQTIGNLFHYVLSKVYDKDFNFELEWNNYLKDIKFTKKELFYLSNLKEEFINIIDVIKYQYSLTGLTNLKLEEKININFGDNKVFTGIIDKIMFKEKDNKTYISIIDYKTGTPCINLSNLKYGIDMQLPIYVYLTVKSNLFNNPKIIGFYLEQILHEKNDDYINNLKLQGYTIDDEYLVSMFDSSYQNSDMIKGMKMTNNGFSFYSKILSDKEINELLLLVEDKINNAYNMILNGYFNINPKIINGENIGCKYCKYNDLCFKSGKDFVYLNDN